MSITVDSSGLCLPVTALQQISFSDWRLLLIGQGPFLHVYSIPTNRRLSTVRIFEAQAIHGIEHGLPCLDSESQSYVSLVVYGGSAVAVARLAIVRHTRDSNGINIHNIWVTYTPSWILRARHHDPASGNSTLLLTADNALLEASHSKVDAGGLQVTHFLQGPKSFLYSGDICQLGITKFLVVGGSVFGQVLVWVCEQNGSESPWESRTTHCFEGHSGSVFGVSISHTLSVRSAVTHIVASCSDDRTVCVWNVSDLERRSDSITESTIKQLPVTGFGSQLVQSSHRLGMASGHMSRIWDVELLPNLSTADNNSVFLISRGEDASCKLWSLQFPVAEAHDLDSAILRPISTDRHHSGKNLFAWTTYKHNSVLVVASGGADGRVIQTPLCLSTGTRPWTLSQPFKTLPVSLASTVLKDYLFVNINTVLALTTSGHLLRCCLSQDLTHMWEVYSSRLTNPVIRLCSNALDGVVTFATRAGIWISMPNEPAFFLPQVLQSVSWMRIVSVTRHTSEWFEVVILITSPAPEPALLIYFDSANSDYAMRTVILNLNQDFTVTSICYSEKRDLLFLGSRSGCIAACSLQQKNIEMSAMILISHSHSSDAVTSLHVIEAGPTHPLYVLSTGRDGTFSMYEFRDGNLPGVILLHTTFRTRPPFLMSIEGAVLSSDHITDQTNLSVFGFRSTEFVVWSHTRQVQLFAVDCGGSHRNWAYTSANAINSEHAFVWTKAGKFNYQRSVNSSPIIIQEGGHGREIKALAIRPDSSEDRRDDHAVMATGAEDTTIRLFKVCRQVAFDKAKYCSFDPCAIVSDHTTGIQHLAFSTCGDYLFSSGGMGEFYAWRVHVDVPIVNLGLMLLDQMPQTEEDSNARIMSFDVLSGDSIYIIMAYSNGKVRGVEYHPGPAAGQGAFVPKLEIAYGAICLMQVRLRLTSQTRLMLLSAGTDGFLHWSPLEDSSSSIRSLRQRIHQSSILAIDVVALDTRWILVVTGGDDNALGFTFLSHNAENQAARDAVTAQTILIPKAHAAALTGLKILSHEQRAGEHHLLLISVSNDQKVKIWGINCPAGLNEMSLHTVRASRLHESWTCVADVSNVGLLRPMRGSVDERELEGQVVTVGVGMEVLKISVKERQHYLLGETPDSPPRVEG